MQTSQRIAVKTGLFFGLKMIFFGAEKGLLSSQGIEVLSN